MKGIQNPSFSSAAYTRYMRSVTRPVHEGRVLTPQIILRQSMKHHQMTLPSGSLVFLRLDVDGKDNGIFREKLETQVEIIQFAAEQGWNAAIVGHRRRPDPSNIRVFFDQMSEDDIGYRFLHHNELFSDLKFLREKTGMKIDYLRYWLGEDYKISEDFIYWINSVSGKTGQIVMLENDRLWPTFYSGINEAAKSAAKGDYASLDDIAENVYYPLGRELQTLGFKGYIFDAISASKEAFWSKTGIAPFMEQAALGPAAARELEAMEALTNATAYYIGGSKLSEKFPAVLEMIRTNRIPLIITGGVVGFALRYCELVAKGEIQDSPENRISLGALYLDPPKEELRITAEQINLGIAVCKEMKHKTSAEIAESKSGVLNPVDFVSRYDPNRTISFEQQYGLKILSSEQQWDIGPQSIRNMTRVLDNLSVGTILVISGVPGRFELPNYGVGFAAMRNSLTKAFQKGCRIIGTGSEGNEVFPAGEHVIAGGVAAQFSAGTTPAAFRIFDEHPSQFE